MLIRMAPLLTRMAHMASMLTRMTRILYTLIKWYTCEI